MPESREIRFGLVLYGGVSLAVYINGVVNEFLRLVRGNGVYKLASWLTDTEMIVDIVSGTSAGGINGVFFAHALINQRDFAEMDQMWRQVGDIAKLLRPLNQPAGAYQSLLDSEGFYHQQLKQALAKMDPYTGTPVETGELDLYVTGTDVDGNVYTVLDDQGHGIDVKDHRSVFWLKHRPYGTAFQTTDDTYEALARLSRITSCFPAAFAPVHVAEPTTASSPDGLLKEWGQLPREAYFLDGGLLANKPFSHTIQAIFSRPVERPSKRVLCYVEPDPEIFADRSAHQPNFFSAALEGAYNIPTYQSIAEDLKTIDEHNSQVERYRQVSREIAGKLAPLFRDATLPTGAGLPENLKEPERSTYGRSRLASIGMRAIRGLAADKGQRSKLDNAQKKKAGELVAELIDMEPRPGGAGQRPVLTDTDSLERFDVYFRLRRLHHLLYYIAVKSEGTIMPAEWVALRRRLNACAQTLEIIRFWMEYIMDRVMNSGPTDWLAPKADVWGGVRWYLEQFLEQGLPIDERPDLVVLHKRLGEVARRVVGLTPDGNFADPFAGMLGSRDDAELSAFAGPGVDEFRLEYQQFVALDVVLYPLEFVSNLEGRDFIQLLRVSPVDAQSGFANRELKDKLAGVSLAHFGGFFKRSWRSNDIMWGRLDGVCEILKQTLARGRLEEITRSFDLRAKVRANIGPDTTRIRELFPHSSAQTAEQVFGWIGELLNPGTSEAALERADAMVNTITEMAQLEVLFDSVPEIAGDQTYEQTRWASGGATETQATIAGDGAAGRALAQYTETPPVSSPQRSKMGVFFRSYQVGSTDLTEAMPFLVVVEIFSRAALVLRECIQGALTPNSRAAAAAKSLFRYTDWPIRMVHWLSITTRNDPVWGSIVQWVLFFVSIATLLLTYMAGWTFASAHFLLCVVLPLLVLLVLDGLARFRFGWIVNAVLGAAGLGGLALAYYQWPAIEAHVTLVRALEAGFDAFWRAWT